MSAAQQPIESRMFRLSSALCEIELSEPTKRSRLVLRVVAVLFLLLLVWSTVAKLDIVAVASGQLVPQTYVKIVQPAEAGIVREILVKVGDVVREGQVLARLDPTLNVADSVATGRELALQQLQLRRIEAELANRPMRREAGDDAALYAQIEAQYESHRETFLSNLAQERAARDRATKELSAAQELLEKLKATLPSYQRTADAYQKLAKDNLVGALQAEEKTREALERAQDLEAQRATVASLEANVSQFEQRIAQVRSSYASDLSRERLDAVANINRLEQQQDKLTYQQALLELRAPQAGVVKELATTTLGAVVQPGTVLLSLVPRDEPLVAEVLIENEDIGFVEPRQSVRIKLAAYPFQKYGMLEGIVKTVSADSISDAGAATRQSRTEGTRQPGLAFKALIELERQQLDAHDLTLPLAAGMQVSAEIVQGRRTVLEYLLSPVQRVASEAGMER